MGRRSGMQVNCYLGWGETAMRSKYPSENHLVQTSPRQNLSSHYSQAHYPLTSPKCSLPRQSRQFYLALVLSHAIVLQTASSFAATGRSSELGNSSQKNLQPVPETSRASNDTHSPNCKRTFYPTFKLAGRKLIALLLIQKSSVSMNNK